MKTTTNTLPSDNIVCRSCGSINDYKVEEKGNHHCAYCNGCGEFIKNIGHQPDIFHFGKFKGKLVSEVDDRQWLEWAVETVKMSPKLRTAVKAKIEKLTL